MTAMQIASARQNCFVYFFFKYVSKNDYDRIIEWCTFLLSKNVSEWM